MDFIASSDISACFNAFPHFKNEPAHKIQAVWQRLRTVQNCCRHCRPLWRQWEKVVNSMQQSALAKGANIAHPSKPVLIGLECIRSLSMQLMTKEDENALTNLGFNLISGKIAGIQESGKTYITYLVNLRCNKQEAQASEEERAAVHYYAELAMKGILMSLVKYRLRQTMILRNRDYRPADNGLYPYRDTGGKAMDIGNIAKISLRTDSGKNYPAEAVKPFISPAITGAERERLFLSLHCRRLTGADVPPQESSLIGQWGVVAAMPIARATCLGVHAGVLVSPLEMGDAELFDHDYIVDLSPKAQPMTYLDGDGITSKINTLFEYDESGLPVGQAKTGYNVECAKFGATLGDRRKIHVIAIFATENIPAGTELRINYHYPDAFINTHHRSPRPPCLH